MKYTKNGMSKLLCFWNYLGETRFDEVKAVEQSDDSRVSAQACSRSQL